MYKIAAMGDKDSVSGFLAIGLEVYFVCDEKSATETLNKLTENDEYAAIFITEGTAAQIHSEIDKFKDSMKPAIILIPGVKGNTGEGLSSVEKSVERAVGSQLAD